MTTLELVPDNKTDVDFPLHVGPLFCLAKGSNQFLEHFCISRCIFKPRQEVKRLPKVMTSGTTDVRWLAGISDLR